MEAKSIIFVMSIAVAFSIVGCKTDVPGDSVSTTGDLEWDTSGLEGAEWSADNLEKEHEDSIQSTEQYEKMVEDYESGIGDTYFISDAEYNYICDSMLDIEGYPKVIKVNVQAVGKSDDIFHVVIDEDVEATARECGDWDRLDLGYFLIEDDTIYNYTGDASDISDSKIKSEGMLIYVSEDKMDKYKDKMAENQYVEWIDGRCIFHYYNDLTETGFYTTMEWSVNKKLLGYRSGFGAERDSIQMYVAD